MQIKGFFTSKLNWLGLLMTADAIFQLADASRPTDYHSWLQFGSGVALIVIRTWFTNTRVEIGGAKP